MQITLSNVFYSVNCFNNTEIDQKGKFPSDGHNSLNPSCDFNSGLLLVHMGFAIVEWEFSSWWYFYKSTSFARIQEYNQLPLVRIVSKNFIVSIDVVVFCYRNIV
jgi:hypothetical protein